MRTRKLTTEEKLARFREQGVRVLDTPPEGWRVRVGALTAPNGYVWYYNGKSLFSDEYESALVKEDKS